RALGAAQFGEVSLLGGNTSLGEQAQDGLLRRQPAHVVGLFGGAGILVSLGQCVERAGPVLRRLGRDGLRGGGELVVEALYRSDATALGGRVAGVDLGAQ